MSSKSNPRVLNLDELELVQSEIAIVHKGVKHQMRTLTVEMFIAQQKRAADHEKMMAAGITDTEADVSDIVTLIRDAVLEFFPTLPVNELETPKLFSVFGWLNDMSAQVNETNAPSLEEDAEGNGEPELDLQTES